MTETAPDALAGGDARPFCEPGRAPARKSSRLVTLGVTGDWAFAAGTLLLALRRHNPDLGADILVFHDDGLRPSDRALLEGLGARCEPFAVACDGLRPEAVRLLSPLSLAKFACFRLLADYESVLWLDTDLVVQDDLGMSSATARWLWPWKIPNSPARAAPAGRLSIFMSPCPVWTATRPI